MGRPFKGHRGIYARLAPPDLADLDRLKRETGAETLSALVEDLLVQLLDETKEGRQGILLMPMAAGTVQRHYRITAASHDRLQAMVRRTGFKQQHVVRAAIARARAGGQSPPKGR